jgi:hypothetical protein
VGTASTIPVLDAKINYAVIIMSDNPFINILIGIAFVLIIGSLRRGGGG